MTRQVSLVYISRSPGTSARINIPQRVQGTNRSLRKINIRAHAANIMMRRWLSGDGESLYSTKK
ncbi:hypothetical protein BDR03DRAFT_119840 [Suillus americanus]|nr:hypothetical protein BDR03DRAFT_119840 [Suillus americanus]